MRGQIPRCPSPIRPTKPRPRAPILRCHRHHIVECRPSRRADRDNFSFLSSARLGIYEARAYGSLGQLGQPATPQLRPRSLGNTGELLVRHNSKSDMHDMLQPIICKSPGPVNPRPTGIGAQQRKAPMLYSGQSGAVGESAGPGLRGAFFQLDPRATRTPIWRYC